MNARPGHSAPPAKRRIRVCYFNQWADGLEVVPDYLARVPAMDLRRRVSDATDAALVRKARLDCDWYAANARCFAAMEHPDIEFLPAWTAGPKAILQLAQLPREPGEERWMISMAHQPQNFGALAGRVFALLRRAGVRQLFYAFDEASRAMPCFNDIAPSLDVLIHDEAPLAARGAAALRPGCVTIHRSWVANLRPGEVPFNETPEEKIYFLGSQLGLTPHRQRQLDFLRLRFGEKLVASVDHTTPVDERAAVARYKVGLCPEGRKFTTPAMSATHTDRPFWSGCLGLVPVSENSVAGDRLQALHESGLIMRYRHGDLEDLAAACERALRSSAAERRRIYDHFNAHETIGAVVSRALHEVGPA